ncbi:hypothetical protein ACTHS2_35330, partial [Streptomyces pseudogriseolus]
MRPRLHTVVHLCAAAFAAGSLGTTLYHGVEDRSTALAFGTLVAVGELTRRGGRGIRPRRLRRFDRC